MSTQHHGTPKPSLTLHQITAVVQQAKTAEFPEDPLLTAEMSRLTSTVSSVIKRHGPLLESAIADALSGSGRFAVLRHVRLPVTAEGRAAAASGRHHPHITLSGRIETRVDADLVALEKETGHLVALQIKRGGGRTDTKKRRQIEGELRAASPTMRAFFARHAPDLMISSCEVRIVDIYGNAGFDPKLTIYGWELDRAFDLPVEAWIAATTTALRAALRAMLPELLAPVVESLAMPTIADERLLRSRAILMGLPPGE